MAPPRSLRSVVWLLASCCAHVAIAIIEIQVKQHDEGCIHLPVIHSTNVHRFSEKRGVQLRLANRSDVAYYAQLSIGTPPQPVFVQLDTGSFELWVNPDCTRVTGGDQAFCDRAGRYDSQKSSTAESLGTTKTLRYGIGSANISYVTDTISLAGSSTALKTVQFGVASASEDTFSGILGIGYGSGYATRYPNFIDQLYAQNATRVKAYTLALGSKDAQEGIIVFGGVDTSKFSGPLVRLPVIPAAKSPDAVPRFWVDMRSMSISPPNSPSRPYAGSNIPVFLDSGSTMTLLPPNLTSAIAADFGVPNPDSNGFYRIDCGFTRAGGTLDFAFPGLTVKVPYKELIREVPGTPPACFLGITPSETFTLLGDTFLRSAYAVFDLENHSVWMTQAANCGSTPAALNKAGDLSSVVGLCSNQVVGAASGGNGGSAVPGSGTGSAETNGIGASTSGSPAAGASVTGRGEPGLIRALVFAAVAAILGSGLVR